ncbi:MAG: transporter [Marmoricola sp.]|nr:transporter [Marmoricola sp.]
MSTIPGSAASPAAPRRLLGLAAIAVAFAAADTYVVVLALPDMMVTVGLSIDQLQRAAPIVSGFLLGYVAMLPLIGRIADLRGRVPVLTASLVVFAFGSLITALAFDLPSVVAGRFLQGVGGGGLVPATLALVADLYPVSQRAVPLGIVSAVQEIGSVLGPLYGAVVLAFADWEGIFWINMVLGLVLAAAIARVASTPAGRARPRLPDPVGLVLLALFLAGLVLMLAEPGVLVRDIVLGWPFVPLFGNSRWAAPLTFVTALLLVALMARCLKASRPLVDLRSWGRTFREADVVGATYLGLALAGVILAFASADPSKQLFSPAGAWLLAGSAILAVAFGWHVRRADHPLVPRSALRRTPAWASLLASFFIGAALIAALVDIPVYARLTSYPDSQLKAALVLVRFLVALPVGAVVGGYLTRRLPAGVVAAGGMVLAAIGFAAMSQWGPTSLLHPVVTVPLVLGGFGFGLALAPVNAVLLASTDAAVHGVTSAFVVVARMIGMLVGISVLTTIGLRHYFRARAALPSMNTVCGDTFNCPKYTHLSDAAVLTQVEAIFIGAAICAIIAALVSVVLFRGVETRSTAVTELLKAG